MLIMLDNAADSDQAAPLLPGDSACTVLVTSRRRLVGLVSAHGARALDLSVLTAEESRELLTRYLGKDRLAAEPRAVADLLGHCAGLPLAISIVAARAADHAGFPLSALAGEFRDRAFRLDALDTGEGRASLRSVLSCSYHALTAEAAAMFGLLGLAPGPDISLSAVAALTALPVPRARVLLRELDNAHLIQEDTPGRYRPAGARARRPGAAAVPRPRHARVGRERTQPERLAGSRAGPLLEGAGSLRGRPAPVPGVPRPRRRGQHAGQSGILRGWPGVDRLVQS